MLGIKNHCHRRHRNLWVMISLGLTLSLISFFLLCDVTAYAHRVLSLGSGINRALAGASLNLYPVLLRNVRHLWAVRVPRILFFAWCR